MCTFRMLGVAISDNCSFDVLNAFLFLMEISPVTLEGIIRVYTTSNIRSNQIPFHKTHNILIFDPSQSSALTIRALAFSLSFYIKLP